MTASNDIPMDDGRIAQALEAVEQRLDAFIHALREIRGQAAPQSSHISTECKRAEESIEKEAPPLSDMENEANVQQSDEPAPVLMETTTPVPQGTGERSSHQTQEKPDNLQEKTPHRRDQSADRKLQSSKCNESQRVTNISSKDEESLPDSLGEEAAAAIRVMRRLSMGTKTVRELLDEYKAMQTNDRPDHSDNRPRKSWFWKRGQEDE